MRGLSGGRRCIQNSRLNRIYRRARICRPPRLRSLLRILRARVRGDLILLWLFFLSVCFCLRLLIKLKKW